MLANVTIGAVGAIRVASLDLIAVQTEISNEVFASLHGLPAGEQMDAPRPAPRRQLRPTGRRGDWSRNGHLWTVRIS